MVQTTDRQTEGQARRIMQPIVWTHNKVSNYTADQPASKYYAYFGGSAAAGGVCFCQQQYSVSSMQLCTAGLSVHTDSCLHLQNR